jgi:hypothetical protein
MPKQPKRYKVIGTQPILEHAPGETFSTVIPKDLESFLIGIGGLEIVKAEPASAPSAKASKTDK